MRHQKNLSVVCTIANKYEQLKSKTQANPSGNEVRLYESVHCHCGEAKADQRGDDNSDDLQPLEPNLVVPADSLEHGPEPMAEMEPDGDEPYQVDKEHPPGSESDREELVGIILEVSDSEKLRHLHLCPVMAQMEEQQAEDHDSKDEHVLGRPGISGSDALRLVTLQSAACLDVLVGNDAAVNDVDQESEGKDGDHDVDEGSRHEVAAKLEESVTVGEQRVVIGDNSEFPGKGINY